MAQSLFQWDAANLNKISGSDVGRF